MTFETPKIDDHRSNFDRYKIEYLVATAAALCMFSVGINAAWAGPINQILSDPNSSFFVALEDTAWLSSLFSVGCIFGAIIGMYSANLWSRSETILLTSIPFGISSLIFAFWQELYPYYAGRVLSGVAAGISFGVAPMYSTEIASVEIRGILGLIMSVASGLGMVAVYSLVPLMDLRSVHYVFFGIALAQFIVCWFIPESPHLLLIKNRDQEAKEVLIKLRGTKDIEPEYLEITKYVEEQKKENVSWATLLTDPVKRRSVVLFSLTILAQQLTGTAPILTYSQRLFDTDKPFISKDLSGVIFASFIFISMFISGTVVERLGRKKLLVLSSIGCAIPLCLLGIFYYLEQEGHEISGVVPLVLMLMHVLFFGFGCGSLPYLYMSEIVSTNVRPHCSCILTILGACAMFSCIQVFNKMDREMGKWAPMFLFMVTTTVAGVVMAMFLIETGGKTFAEIEDRLAGRKKVNK